MASPLSPCPACGAPVDRDQRYCLRCGAPCSDESARLLGLATGTPSPSPSPVLEAERLAERAVPPPERGGGTADGPDGHDGRAGAAAVPLKDDRRAVLSIAFACVGVALLLFTGWGSNTAETLASALPPGLSVNYPGGTAAAPVAAAPPEIAAETPVDDTVVDDTVVDDTPVDDTVVDGTVDDTAADDTTTDDTETDSGGDTGDDEVQPPPVKHVFVVVLADQDVAAVAQTPADAPYLANTLAPQGTILAGYRGVASSGLANQIALLSGQGPTNETLQNCPTYAGLAPGTIDDDGQETGAGCAFSVQTGTLGDQVASNGGTWRAYVEGPAGAGCRHPEPGAADPWRTPTPTDAAVTWRNPFAYFHTATDNPDCAKLVTGLDALDADLAAGDQAPALMYVIPDRCHDGSAEPCSPGVPAGTAAADAWLSTVIPQILASKAYADDGLLVITSDRTEPNSADDPACCRPKTYPNAQDAGQGGRVGAVLVSPYVAKGKVVETSYSHFTLLRTVEDVLKLPPLGYANAKDAGSLVPDVVAPEPVE